MALILCKFATGSDTTGNGSLETPYKTLEKAASVHTQADIIGLLDDQPLSATVTCPTYASYQKVNAIIGVNDLGIEDGTRRRVYATVGGVTAFTFGATNYVWHIRNIDFEDFAIVISGTTSYSFILSNFSCTNCAQLSSDNTFGTMNAGLIEDFTITNMTITTVLHGVTMRNGIFRGCSGANAVVRGSTGGGIIENVVFVDCSFTGNGYSITYGCGLRNVIFDRCTVNNTSNGYIFLWGGSPIVDVLVTDPIYGIGGTKGIIIAQTNSSRLLERVAYYGNTRDVLVGQSSYSDNYSDLVELAELPYVDPNRHISLNYALKPDFAWRRKEYTLGQFRSLITTVNK